MTATPPGGRPLVLVAGGGTGGHLFPAEALSEALRERGVTVALATDARAAQYGGGKFDGGIHLIPSATLRGRDPVSVATMLARQALGFARAFVLLGRLKPAAVVGFGGYPTLPPVLAARARGVPTLIHEQNGVMGRANRFLAPYATTIVTAVPGLLAQDMKLAAKTICLGNPVRPAVVAAAAMPYDAPSAEGAFRLVVFGGSQGAQIMADIVPAAVARLEPRLQMRLTVVQQARTEDVERVRNAYAQHGVACEVAEFFSDLPARIAASHLVVSRSGASTVAELAAIGRPALLVPLPHALDQDQAANASLLEQAGGGIRIDQSLFSPDRLAAEIAALAAAPARLAAMAQAAKSIGVLDAAAQVADQVMKIARIRGEGRASK